MNHKIHVRRTRWERDTQSAQADCYCGKSAYAVECTVPYGTADGARFVSQFCRRCLVAIGKEAAK
jgi:hypothetical protein